MRTEPSFSAESNDQLHAGLGSAGAVPNSESQPLSDYRQRYGLSSDPFIDDPHFPFYQGAQRRQILEQLLHLCQFSHNLLVVTGDYGVGKTRMAQALIDSLDDIDDICFVEGQITSDTASLFSEIFVQFELADTTGFTELCLKKSDQDGLVVLIIDNAHHLTDVVIADLINLLEENFESRLHLVLFAEPHLLERLNNVDAPDIVLTDFFLEKFSLPESVDYLNFRMEMADYLGPEIFLENKVEPWWRQSQGQLLALHDYAQEKLLESVSGSRGNKEHKAATLVPHIVAASVLIGALFLGYLYVGGESKEKPVSQITESFPIAGGHESASISSQANSQSSLPVVSDVAAVVVVEKNSEQTYSLSNTSTSTSNVELEKAKASQEIKQSVVPLAQTNNEFHSQVVQQPSKASVSSTAADAKKITLTTASSKPKSTTKINAENGGDASLNGSAIYSTQEKTILSWDESEFTLQIVGLSSEKSALEFIAVQSNKKDLLLFKTIRQGKNWYVVVAGHYANAATARQAAKSLPESQLKGAPWPRELKTIHREIRQRQI